MKLGKMIIVSAALAFVLPVASTEITSYGAAFAKGGGGGGGKSESKSKSSNSKKSSSGSSKASSSKQKSSGGGLAKLFSKKGAAKQAPKVAAPKPAKVQKAAAAAAVAGAAVVAVEEVKEKNLHAQLKGLNSLKRNINGIMNSSDPKMEPVRAFIEASADYEQALAAQDEAFALYTSAQDSFAATAESYGFSSDPAIALEEIAAMRAEIDATAPLEGEEGYDAYLAQVATLATVEASATATLSAQGTYDGSVEDVADLESAVSDEAFQQMIVDAYNATGQGGLTVEDLSPEMISWVEAQMGVGEADGAIDDYMAMLTEEAAAQEDVLAEDGSDDEAAEEDAPSEPVEEAEVDLEPEAEEEPV